MRALHRRSGVAAAVIGCIALLAATIPVAAAVLWTMTVSPTTAVEGESTTFTFTVTNGDALALIGCVVVQLPRSFAYESGHVVDSSSGAEWRLERSGRAVSVHAVANGGRLRALESVRFAITLTPQETGTHAFAGDAYSAIDCTGTASPLALAPTVLVSAGATPIPTPTPTPTPKSLATPTPTPLTNATPTPTPDPPASPGASDSAAPSAQPSETDAAETPGGTGSEGPGGSGPDASPAASGGSSQRDGGGSISALGIDPLSGEPSADAPVSLNLGPLSALGGAPEWSIPAVVVGTPGVLLILWVALQVSAALAWFPLVRRLRGSPLMDGSPAAADVGPMPAADAAPGEAPGGGGVATGT